MFTRKQCPYALRDSSILVRPKVNLTQYGLKSFKSYGAKIWNILPRSFKADISLNEFKTMIKSWNGPKCKCSVCDIYTSPSLHIYIYPYVCFHVCVYADSSMHAYIHIWHILRLIAYSQTTSISPVINMMCCYAVSANVIIFPCTRLEIKFILS